MGEQHDTSGVTRALERWKDLPARDLCARGLALFVAAGADQGGGREGVTGREVVEVRA